MKARKERLFLFVTRFLLYSFFSFRSVLEHKSFLVVDFSLSSVFESCLYCLLPFTLHSLLPSLLKMYYMLSVGIEQDPYQVSFLFLVSDSLYTLLKAVLYFMLFFWVYPKVYFFSFHSSFNFSLIPRDLTLVTHSLFCLDFFSPSTDSKKVAKLDKVMNDMKKYQIIDQQTRRQE